MSKHPTPSPEQAIHFADINHWHLLDNFINDRADEDLLGTLLCIAAQQNNRVRVAQLLALNANRQTLHEEKTAIEHAMDACPFEPFSCVHAFLGYPPTDGDSENYGNALLECAIRGWTDVAIQLTEMPHINLYKTCANNASNQNAGQVGYFPLGIAQRNGDTELVKALLTAGAHPHKGGYHSLTVTPTPCASQTALASNDVEIAEIFATHFTDLVKEAKKRSIKELTFQAWAQLPNWEAIVAYAAILTDDALVEIGQTRASILQHLLNIAALQNNADAIRLLIEAGADIKSHEVNKKMPVEYALDASCWRVNTSDTAYLLLLPQPIESNEDITMYHFAFLHATMTGNLTAALSIHDAWSSAYATVEKPTHLDGARKTGLGWQAIHFVTAQSMIDVLRLLLEHGVDPDMRSRPTEAPYTPITPLEIALEANNADCAMLLAQQGATPNIPALIAAGLCNRWESVQAFVNNTSLENNVDWSPLAALAAEAGKTEIQCPDHNASDPCRFLTTLLEDIYSDLLSQSSACSNEEDTDRIKKLTDIVIEQLTLWTVEELYYPGSQLITDNDYKSVASSISLFLDIMTVFAKSTHNTVAQNICRAARLDSWTLKIAARSGASSSIIIDCLKRYEPDETKNQLLADMLVDAIESNHADNMALFVNEGAPITTEMILALATLPSNWQGLTTLVSLDAIKPSLKGIATRTTPGDNVERDDDDNALDIHALIAIAEYSGYANSPDTKNLLHAVGIEFQDNPVKSALVAIVEYFNTKLDNQEYLAADPQARREHFMHAMDALSQCDATDFLTTLNTHFDSAKQLSGGLWGLGNSNTYANTWFAAFKAAAEEAGAEAALAAFLHFETILHGCADADYPVCVMLTNPDSYLKQPVASTSDVAAAMVEGGVFDRASGSTSDSDDDLTVVEAVSEKDKARLKKKDNDLFAL